MWLRISFNAMHSHQDRLVLQNMRCKDVPTLLEYCCTMVPGAWTKSAALEKTLAKLAVGDRLDVHEVENARFCHMRLHDLRLSDVPSLVHAHQSLTALQTA